MANTFKFSKITNVFNQYLSEKNLNMGFISFCKAQGFISGVPAKFNYDSLEQLDDTYELALNGKKFKNQQLKIENIMKFVEKNHKSFNKQDIARIKEQVYTFCETNDVNLNLDADTNQFYKDYKFFRLNRRKRHGRMKSFAKKGLLPIAIVSALTGGASLIISSMAAIIGTSTLISTVPALQILSHTVLGALVGAVGTFSYMKISKNIVRNAYKKKGTKGTNISKLDNSDVATVKDVKHLDLPIFDLLNDINTNQDKLIELAERGTNPFLHPINALKSYWITKRNRDRMHEVVAFTNLLEERANKINKFVAEESNSENPSEECASLQANVNKYNLLLGAINEYKDDLKSKVILTMLDKNSTKQPKNKDKYKTTKQLFEYADIWAKDDLKKANEKTTDYNVDKEVSRFLDDAVTKRFTSGTEATNPAKEAIDKAAKQEERSLENSGKKSGYISAERDMLEVFNNNDIHTISTITAVPVDVINRINDILKSRHLTTTGKIKTSPYPLRTSAEFTEICQEDAKFKQYYLKLLQYCVKNTKELTQPTTNKKAVATEEVTVNA